MYLNQFTNTKNPAQAELARDECVQRTRVREKPNQQKGNPNSFSSTKMTYEIYYSILFQPAK